MPTGDGHSQLAHWLVGHVPRARDTRVRVTVKFRPLSRFEGVSAHPSDLRPLPHLHQVGHAAAGLRGRRQSLENCTANMSIFINMSMICISKLLRANGGCLGDYYRRRTWEAAKCHGELLTELRPVDVRMGKPGTRHGVSLRSEYIGPVEGTG